MSRLSWNWCWNRRWAEWLAVEEEEEGDWDRCFVSQIRRRRLQFPPPLTRLKGASSSLSTLTGADRTGGVLPPRTITTETSGYQNGINSEWGKLIKFSLWGSLQLWLPSTCKANSQILSHNLSHNVYDSLFKMSPLLFTTNELFLQRNLFFWLFFFVCRSVRH